MRFEKYFTSDRLGGVLLLDRFRSCDLDLNRRLSGLTSLEYDRYRTLPDRAKSRYLSLHPLDNSRRTREPSSRESFSLRTASSASRSSSNSTKPESPKKLNYLSLENCN